jgi:hypothetical protein
MTEHQQHETNLDKKEESPQDNVSLNGSGTMNATHAKKVEWSPENETIMVEWCDIAQCYKWLHTKAHAKYKSRNAWYTIPAIVLSTISGTASFAQTSLPLEYQAYSPMVIGGINIFIGILTTVQQYLKISELNEAHRVSSISWDKFARNIRIELAKHPDERMDAGSFLKMNRQEFDRLMETSPMIDEKIVDEFKAKFKGRDGTVERKHFDDLKKPDICDIIVSANETRHTWYLESKSEDVFEDPSAVINEKDELINSQKKLIDDKERTLKLKAKQDAEKERKRAEELTNQMKKKMDEETAYKEKIKPLQEYIKTFEDMYSRRPHKDEIYDNNKDDVDSEILKRYLEEYVINNV